MLMGYCATALASTKTTDECADVRSASLGSRPVVPYFQPIERLSDGVVVGFEALARLRSGDRLMSPAEFLPNLSTEETRQLFSVMLDQALRLPSSLGAAGRDVYVTVNVEASLFMSDGFPDVVARSLARHAPFRPGSLVLELLEGEAVADPCALAAALEAVRALGVTLALDDIGSAYSSLQNLRSLPVDVVKLDQCFARGLRDRPFDLHFVLSMQGLAHALGKRLIVEGVETIEILDALRVLGVEFGQGYGIARPMPADAVPAWLDRHVTRPVTLIPQTLLGAYSGHLRVVETCRVLMGQPLPIEWKSASKDAHACGIGRYFDACGTHDGPCGLAHKRFHEVMASYATDPAAWRAGADGFRVMLEATLAAERVPAPVCEAVP